MSSRGEELTLAQIDHHTDAVDELDVQGILVFAERIVRAHQTCGSRRGSITTSGCNSGSSRKDLRTTEVDSIDRRHGTAFNYLAPSEPADEKMVSPAFANWNQLERCCEQSNS